MAAREFRCRIKNEWDEPIYYNACKEDFHGDWQEPWEPDRRPGAGQIMPGETAEWRAESGSTPFTGTDGWARWAVKVLDISDPEGEHFEYIEIGWNVPYVGIPSVSVEPISRNNPSESDVFAVRSNRASVLEIIKTSQEGIATNTPAELVPYVVAGPAIWAFDVNSSSVKVSYVVRRKPQGQAQSRLMFPNMLPSRQQMAMQSFRQRGEIAPTFGFLSGFPNFYQATEGRNHFGGTVFVTPAAAEWQNIPLAQLGNVALEDFEGRMRATNIWAIQHGFVGGFPTFFHADYGHGVVCGAILLKADGAEFREIELSDLGSPALDDFEARFRATQEYAFRNDFVGGFPTLHHYQAVVDVDPRTGQRRRATVCGTVLLKKGELDIHTMQNSATYASRRNVLLYQDPA